MSDKPRVELADKVIAEAAKLRIAAFEEGGAFMECIFNLHRLLQESFKIKGTKHEQRS
jgi:hypothetical protein